MSSRAVRLLVVPAILFVIVSGTVFVLAQLHPAKDEAPAAAASEPTGPGGGAANGAQLFAENCASCHGERGTGGGVGPTLAGSEISIDEARATIENGSGVMPADLVSGQDLEDVLAFLETIFAL
jgi:mono/diheme cytochrome c family protein